jgi:hypothetical protein
MASAAKPDLASAMYPALSRETRQREASEARAREEQKMRNKRMAQSLRAITEQLRQEREGRG